MQSYLKRAICTSVTPSEGTHCHHESVKSRSDGSVEPLVHRTQSLGAGFALHLGQTEGLASAAEDRLRIRKALHLFQSIG